MLDNKLPRNIAFLAFLSCFFTGICLTVVGRRAANRLLFLVDNFSYTFMFCIYPPNKTVITPWFLIGLIPALITYCPFH